ncbi:hypothetical protein [Winogradskyella immobilis]|uniref:Uncharacterized protein n=1 Tax=Winogradskyella immobilis TaxID=2816852 RepID=A0ABS8EMQ5_9FLAO|nr:hypothetical protein [Winogradskyella immobilis]MCC1483597.1 hypothetical protein [Winogradskyella immobilis]MCG0015691.1 hypothetical protein [Winogradskyella immobilis]
MEKSKFAECEARGLHKLINFRLPRYCFTLGLTITGLSILAMFVRAFALEGDTEWLKLLLQKTLLVGLLLISIAKDPIEDELIIKLRAQSYTYAFMTGVIYALVMPYVEFGVSNVLKPEGEAFHNLGDFQVLLFMLMVQVLCFNTLKRIR